MRADLHVHSYYSGPTGSLRFFKSRDCYSSPQAIYRRAKVRGMDLVTITDHNSIDGCLELLSCHPQLPDFVVGEEVECRYPGTDLRMHVGVFGLDEAVHRELQRLRPNVFDVATFLREKRLFFVLNHPFYFYAGQVPVRRYVEEMLTLFPGVEVRNGTMAAEHNELADRIVDAWLVAHGGAMARVGGSDAHVLGHVGRTYTESAARTVTEFFETLRAGRTRARGRHGSALTVAYNMCGVIVRFWAGLLGLGRHECSRLERARSLALCAASAPLIFFIPLAVCLVLKSRECRRVRRWAVEM